MTGGVINAITKSGGNVFNGDALRLQRRRHADSRTTRPTSARPETTTTVANLDRRGDFGFNLGGYIIKDRLWFFGAYDRVEHDRQLASSATSRRPALRRSARDSDGHHPRPLRRQADLAPRRQNQRSRSSAIRAESLDARGRDLHRLRTPDHVAKAKQKTGAATTPRCATTASSARTSACSAIVGRHARRTSEYSGAGKLTPLTIDQTVSPTSAPAGSAAIPGFRVRPRHRQARRDQVPGRHELKAGADWELQDSSINASWNGGGMHQSARAHDVARPDGIYYRHRFLRRTTWRPASTPTTPATWQPQSPLVTEPETDQQLVLRAGQLAVRLRTSPSTPAFAGSARRSATASATTRSTSTTMSAAPRRRLGLRAQRPQQAVRELRPLLRVHPDGHQHPGVRRRGPVLLLQLRPGPA